MRVKKGVALLHGLVPLSMPEVTLFVRLLIARETMETSLRRHVTVGE